MVDEALRLSTEVRRDGHAQQRSLQVVYTTRDSGIAKWYIEEIDARLSQSTTLAQELHTRVSVHVTSNHDSVFSELESSDEKNSDGNGAGGKTAPTEITTTASFSLNVLRNARLRVSDIVESSVGSARAHPLQNRGHRLGVLVCGPASMIHDTRVAAAKAQSKVLAGEIEEVYLHSEPFA